MLKRKEKRVSRRILALPLLVLFAAGVWFLWVRYEGGKPEIHFSSLPGSIGVSSELTVRVSDAKSGLRRVWIGLLTEGKETPLFERTYAAEGLFEGGSVKSADLRIPIDPKKLGIKDGAAILRMAVWDYSWRKWWHGNNHYIEKEVTIDTRPPGLEVISRTHNVRQGGSGLVIYRLSEACPEHGVLVGEELFPGHSGYFKDENVYLSFFALSHLQGRGTRLVVRAVDAAGNINKSGFPHYIRKKTFKKDRINISDGFLNRKMPEFMLNTTDQDASLLASFLAINQKMREENFKKVQMVGAKTEKSLYWHGAFGRLPQSATRATFADVRDYYYKGKVVDQQRHLGIDLASISHAEVPAANSGKVVFTGDIGIYGKTVMIDHGFGLFSMYAHLSHISTADDIMVNKGQIIGNTGATGLAGGDHLHLSIMVHNTFVDPIEWWDMNWIRNNIIAKLDMAAERFPRAGK